MNSSTVSYQAIEGTLWCWTILIDTDCCRCRGDNYDICTDCFAVKDGCKGVDHGSLKVRFWGDGMLSLSELSLWVGQLKLPIADE